MQPSLSERPSLSFVKHVYILKSNSKHSYVSISQILGQDSSSLFVHPDLFTKKYTAKLHVIGSPFVIHDNICDCLIFIFLTFSRTHLQDHFSNPRPMQLGPRAVLSFVNILFWLNSKMFNVISKKFFPRALA